MTLSKYDEKYLDSIRSDLEAIQYFIDENIQGSNTMTAAAICEGFIEASEQNLDSDIFIKGLRVAIREKLITGIVGAGRAGYKREGETMMSADEAALEAFALYIEGVQKFVEKNLTDFMPSTVIYERFCKQNECDLSEAQFRRGFSLAVKDELIEGLTCIRGKGKGYILTSALKLKDKEAYDKAQEETEESEQCVIEISSGKRIVATDRFNWSYQALHGNTWVTEGYYPNVKNCVHSLATKMLDSELKELDKFNIKEVCQKFEECVTRITNVLERILPREENKAA